MRMTYVCDSILICEEEMSLSESRMRHVSIGQLYDFSCRNSRTIEKRPIVQDPLDVVEGDLDETTKFVFISVHQKQAKKKRRSRIGGGIPGVKSS